MIDMQNMLESTKFVRRVGKTSPLADIIGTAPWIQSRVHTVADGRLAVLSSLRVLGSTRAQPRSGGTDGRRTYRLDQEAFELDCPYVSLPVFFPQSSGHSWLGWVH